MKLVVRNCRSKSKKISALKRENLELNKVFKMERSGKKNKNRLPDTPEASSNETLPISGKASDKLEIQKNKLENHDSQNSEQNHKFDGSSTDLSSVENKEHINDSPNSCFSMKTIIEEARKITVNTWSGHNARRNAIYKYFDRLYDEEVENMLNVNCVRVNDGYEYDFDENLSYYNNYTHCENDIESQEDSCSSTDCFNSDEKNVYFNKHKNCDEIQDDGNEIQDDDDEIQDDTDKSVNKIYENNEIENVTKKNDKGLKIDFLKNDFNRDEKFSYENPVNKNIDNNDNYYFHVIFLINNMTRALTLNRISAERVNILENSIIINNEILNNKFKRLDEKYKNKKMSNLDSCDKILKNLYDSWNQIQEIKNHIAKCENDQLDYENIFSESYDLLIKKCYSDEEIDLMLEMSNVEIYEYLEKRDQKLDFCVHENTEFRKHLVEDIKEDILNKNDYANPNYNKSYKENNIICKDKILYSKMNPSLVDKNLYVSDSNNIIVSYNKTFESIKNLNN